MLGGEVIARTHTSHNRTRVELLLVIAGVLEAWLVGVARFVSAEPGRPGAVAAPAGIQHDKPAQRPAAQQSKNRAVGLAAGIRLSNVQCVMTFFLNYIREGERREDDNTSSTLHWGSQLAAGGMGPTPAVGVGQSIFSLLALISSQASGDL